MFSNYVSLPQYQVTVIHNPPACIIHSQLFPGTLIWIHSTGSKSRGSSYIRSRYGWSTWVKVWRPVNLQVSCSNWIPITHSITSLHILIQKVKCKAHTRHLARNSEVEPVYVASSLLRTKALPLGVRGLWLYLPREGSLCLQLSSFRSLPTEIKDPKASVLSLSNGVIL